LQMSDYIVIKCCDVNRDRGSDRPISHAYTCFDDMV